MSSGKKEKPTTRSIALEEARIAYREAMKSYEDIMPKLSILLVGISVIIGFSMDAASTIFIYREVYLAGVIFCVVAFVLLLIPLRTALVERPVIEAIIQRERTHVEYIVASGVARSLDSSVEVIQAETKAKGQWLDAASLFIGLGLCAIFFSWIINFTTI